MARDMETVLEDDMPRKRIRIWRRSSLHVSIASSQHPHLRPRAIHRVSGSKSGGPRT